MKSLDIKSLKGITQDSRGVKRGYMFAALPGSKFDGRDYMSDAIRNGARVILAPKGTVLPGDVDRSSVELITDANPRRALAMIAAEFYGRQPDQIVAVTGTNGKTSTVNFAEQIWNKLGVKAASLGTLGMRSGSKVKSGAMTTPDPVSLQAELADLASAGISHLAMEASSHGLDQYRLDGAAVKVAGFTNLSRDHLDYHESMEEYFQAKLRLFTEILSDDGLAVLNVEDTHTQAIIEALDKRGVRSWGYGRSAKELKVIKANPETHGQDLSIIILGERYDFTLPLVGDFQVMNVMCALGMVIAEFEEDRSKIDEAIEALKTLDGVPGRMQLVKGFAGHGAVYIDYAHTPDALDTVLTALRPHTAGKLVALIGCGGDRDKGKRPMMGKIAATLADHVIVSDDNPRSESPANIRKDIMRGAPEAKEIAGRSAAIKSAIADLNKDDVLVIAGKGHEQGQIFADRTEPFDDYEQAEQALKELESAGVKT